MREVVVSYCRKRECSSWRGGMRSDEERKRERSERERNGEEGGGKRVSTKGEAKT